MTASTGKLCPERNPPVRQERKPQPKLGAGMASKAHTYAEEEPAVQKQESLVVREKGWRLHVEKRPWAGLRGGCGRQETAS